jgi:hypothetical protein
MKDKNFESRVTALLYMLIRDKIPAGELIQIIAELENNKGIFFVFTNSHIEALAEQLTERLK